MNGQNYQKRHQNFGNVFVSVHSIKSTPCFNHMQWNQVIPGDIITTLGKNGRRSFTYHNEPLRFQLPESKCIFGLSEYNSLSLRMNDDFIEWYGGLERSLNTGCEPWSSALSNDLLRIKVDQNTWVFDKTKQIDESDLYPERFQGYTIKCIIELCGIYYFKNNYGFTIKTYQLLYDDGDEECLIDLVED